MNEELLISLVQQYTELFNHEDPHYHDDQRRMNIWEEIGRIMNKTPTACKEKWKKIRENFRKAINLRKTKSGQEAKNFKPIRYGKELSFLTPYMQNESESLTNLPPISSDEEQGNITSPPSTPESPATTVSANSTTKKKKIQETSTNSQSLFQSYLEKKYSHDRQEEKDPTVEFFKNLGHTVKTFPPDLRVRVKRAVFSIVSEAEEEMITRDAPLTIPNTSFYQYTSGQPAPVVIRATSQLPSTDVSQSNVQTRLFNSQDVTSAPIVLSTSQTSVPQTGSYAQFEEFITFPRK